MTGPDIRAYTDLHGDVQFVAVEGGLEHGTDWRISVSRDGRQYWSIGLTAKQTEKLYALMRRMFETDCEWTEDEDGTWNTECGDSCEFSVDGPVEVNCKFCHHCGKKILLIGLPDGHC